MFFKLLLGFPKTLFINFYCLPFNSAKHLPIIVAPNVRIKCFRNNIFIKNPREKIFIGFSGSFQMGDKTVLSFSKEARLVLNGKTVISRGSKIIVNSHLEIGKNFFCNSNCIINAGKKIYIGDNCTFGWGTTILDGDGHKIIFQGMEQPLYKSITICDNVWLGSDVTILKGSIISQGSVVASKGCISKQFQDNNLLLGGYNKILKRGISWEL